MVLVLVNYNNSEAQTEQKYAIRCRYVNLYSQ